MDFPEGRPDGYGDSGVGCAISLVPGTEKHADREKVACSAAAARNKRQPALKNEGKKGRTMDLRAEAENRLEQQCHKGGPER